MNFKIQLLVALIVFSSISVGYCQLFHPEIDTSNSGVKDKISFIQEFFKAEDQKPFWHPKYIDSKRYNFSTLIDGLSRNKTPKQLLEKYDIRINEIQELNVSISFFKYEINEPAECHAVEYKLYIVESGQKLFLDNCKDYEKHRFKYFYTPNISFYVSPWIDIDQEKFEQASKKLDALYDILGGGKAKPHVENYLCSSIEEMNILTNMVHFYGYVGGFTEMEHNFIVAHNSDPFYLHEFIHVILGSSASGKNFILGEGIASYLGGISKETSYEDGVKYLTNCFNEGRCTFDLLYQRKIYNPRDNIPTYAFAAIICNYIIDNFGIDYFLKLYYDPNVTSDHLIDIIVKEKNISKDQIIKYVHDMVKFKN